MFINEYIAEFDRAVEAALLGRETPKEALDHATKNINAVIQRYRASVGATLVSPDTLARRRAGDRSVAPTGASRDLAEARP
jgi:hypothetical protein